MMPPKRDIKNILKNNFFMTPIGITVKPHYNESQGTGDLVRYNGVSSFLYQNAIEFAGTAKMLRYNGDSL